VAKYPVELRVRQAIQASIASDEKSAERKGHGFTTPIQQPRSGRSRRSHSVPRQFETRPSARQ
jgi:hypothetical protein